MYRVVRDRSSNSYNHTTVPGLYAMSGSKHFLITGAGRGIGRGLSRLLLQKGHRVFLIDNNKDELNNTEKLLSQKHKSGTDFDVLLCNVRNPSEITSAAQKAHRLFNGHLDCLVNNAGCKNVIFHSPR